MESSWNEKLGFRWLVVSVKKIKEETQDFKIVVDEIDQPGKGKKKVERKLVRSDFSAEAWNRIKPGGIITLPIKEMIGIPIVVAAAFPKEFNWGDVSGGDFVFYCEKCGDVFVVSVADDPWADLDKMGEIHALNSPSCDGIIERKFVILDHRSDTRYKAMDFLAAKISQKSK